MAVIQLGILHKLFVFPGSRIKCWVFPQGELIQKRRSSPVLSGETVSPVRRSATTQTDFKVWGQGAGLDVFQSRSVDISNRKVGQWFSLLMTHPYFLFFLLLIHIINVWTGLSLSQKICPIHTILNHGKNMRDIMMQLYNDSFLWFFSRPGSSLWVHYTTISDYFWPIYEDATL